MDGRYDIGDVVLGNWTLTKLIGEGSFGRVYEARREDFGFTYKAAVKIITIPQNQSEITNARAEGMDSNSVTAYFRGLVEELVQEFALMSRLKGTANVVSYEDHTVITHEGGIGWDIIIRMELLKPLLNYTVEHAMTRKDVIKLGIDICRALELCQKFNIVHRDIKPENIFVSELGDFKLGDFGIARTVERTTGLSKKGTYTYMAPEVYREEPYGSGVDIYSLGIVLYKLLNDNRTPFLPEYPAPITHADRENSLTRRINGDVLPKPKNADGRLAEIVLKACAYDPKDRYSSPMQMREELEAILYSEAEAPVIYPDGDETPIKSENNIPTDAPAPVPTPAPEPATEPAAVQTTAPEPAPEPEPVAEPEDEKTTDFFWHKGSADEGIDACGPGKSLLAEPEARMDLPWADDTVSGMYQGENTAGAFDGLPAAESPQAARSAADAARPAASTGDWLLAVCPALLLAFYQIIMMAVVDPAFVGFEWTYLAAIIFDLLMFGSYGLCFSLAGHIAAFKNEKCSAVCVLLLVLTAAALYGVMYYAYMERIGSEYITEMLMALGSLLISFEIMYRVMKPRIKNVVVMELAGSAASILAAAVIYAVMRVIDLAARGASIEDLTDWATIAYIFTGYTSPLVLCFPAILFSVLIAGIYKKKARCL